MYMAQVMSSHTRHLEADVANSMHKQTYQVVISYNIYTTEQYIMSELPDVGIYYAD